MIILDLALQGIRDIAGSVRVRLQSGYNAVTCGSVNPATVRFGLIELLFTQVEKQARFASPLAKSCGGGVTLMTADGSTFRVMRDLIGLKSQLLEFKRETRTFARLSTNNSEIAEFLRSKLGLPSRPVFNAVYVLDPQNLPSAKNGPEVFEEEALGNSGMELQDKAKLKSRLGEIEKILADKALITELEFEVDGLQKQRFAKEDRIRELTFDRTELEAALVEGKQLAYLDVLPNDFLKRYEIYLQTKERLEADLDRWRSEREIIERTERMKPPEPLLKDWRLWGGLVGGAAAIFVGAFFGGWARWLALADIPAFGLAAIVLFKNLSMREERVRAKWKLRMSDERKSKIIARDQEAISEVESYLKKIEANDPKEIRDLVLARDTHRTKIRALEKAECAAENNPERKELEAERDKLAAQITAIDERLTSLAASPIDEAALKTEMEDIRLQLGEDLTLGTEESKDSASEITESTKCPLGERWLKSAYELLLADPQSACRVLSERASLLLRALSENRLTSLALTPAGQINISPADHEPVAWDAMPGAAQDLAYLAFYGALFLAIEPKFKAPMIALDLTGRLAAGGLLVCQTLFVTLAHSGQVIHLVRRAEQAPQAKNVVALGTGG